MYKYFILPVILIVFFRIAHAQEINEPDARIIGKNFLLGVTSLNARTGEGLELAYKANSRTNDNAATASPSETYFYVYNAKEGNGFVIVAGNESVNPILAYSNEGTFDPDHIPQSVAKWLEGYKKEIAHVSRNKIQATTEIRSAWQELRSGELRTNPSGRTSSVTPLIKTKWNQSPFYNDLCPFDSHAGEKAVTGCVATTMAQIMKFWNYPKTGSSYSSYSHATYGTLSANYGATSYQWGSMPNTLSSSNLAVATLMYHCGVSVKMNYGPDGSSAYLSDAATAYKTYFNYSSSIASKFRSSYTETQWKSLVKSELDAGRPVHYAGSGTGGGHSFICDGYDDNDFFHFNWGWGGASDGYFSVNALNPGALGTGGGTGGFNSGQHIIIGIQPPAGSIPVNDMKLFSAITVSPAPVIYKAGFTVNVNLSNTGTSAASNFSGDIAAAVFNSNGQFVTYIETKTGMSLSFNSHFTNPIVFTSAGIDAMIPGDYTIGIYYKPTGATEWIAFADGSYQNFTAATVLSNAVNPLRLYAAIIPTPAPVIQNQALTIKFDVLNSGATSFAGDISIDLHSSDGTWIRTLAQLTGTTMASNAHFSNGLVASIPLGLSETPGTYQLFVWSKPNGGQRAVLGNGNFSNPVNILLAQPSLPADPYEVNNTSAQAYTLPVTFTGNTASKTTTGSNCHTGTDYDYYKINLPAGMNYAITPRLHDSNNSSNGNTYTLDAVFSYSTDGTTWSDAYDDVLSEDIVLPNGGTVYLFVAPYFSGEKGTYLLDISIIKSPVKQNQAITFASLANKTIGDAPFTLTATANSGLTVSYASSNTAVATVSNNTITVLAAGTTTITASQTGNATYSAATKVTQTLTVVKKAQTITFAAIANKTLGDAPFTLAATATSGLTIGYASSNTAVATVSNNTITILSAGTTTITASQAGDATYSVATNATQTLTVVKKTQVITFNAPSVKTFGDAAFDLAATASSGLSVSYTTTSDKINISGSQVTIIKTGRTTITASQSGNATFLSATPVDQSFCIKPVKPVVTITGINTESPLLTSSAVAGNQWYKNGTAISAATNSTLSVTVAAVYKVQVTTDDCASDFSADVPIIITQDTSLPVSKVILYPNPVDDHLEVLGIDEEIRSAQFIDMTGRSQWIKFEKRQEAHYADVPPIPAGVYFLRVEEGNRIHQLKFVKR